MKIGQIPVRAPNLEYETHSASEHAGARWVVEPLQHPATAARADATTGRFCASERTGSAAKAGQVSPPGATRHAARRGTSTCSGSGGFTWRSPRLPGCDRLGDHAHRRDPDRPTSVKRRARRKSRRRRRADHDNDFRARCCSWRSAAAVRPACRQSPAGRWIDVPYLEDAVRCGRGRGGGGT